MKSKTRRNQTFVAIIATLLLAVLIGYFFVSQKDVSTKFESGHAKTVGTILEIKSAGLNTGEPSYAIRYKFNSNNQEYYGVGVIAPEDLIKSDHSVASSVPTPGDLVEVIYLAEAPGVNKPLKKELK